VHLRSVYIYIIVLKKLKILSIEIKSVFNSVVMVAFQITFRAEIHTNDIFFIFKKLFLTAAHQNDPKHIKYIKF